MGFSKLSTLQHLLAIKSDDSASTRSVEDVCPLKQEPSHPLNRALLPPDTSGCNLEGLRSETKEAKDDLLISHSIESGDLGYNV